MHGMSIEPLIIPRSDHTISRDNISESALKVLYRLHKAGFASYLVGGCVRDMLLNRNPKDFDVATDAHPEEIRKLFRNCRLIGRRFRLAHIRFGREIIEVATFRGHHDPEGEGDNITDDGIITRDNEYGTLEEDAFRRDFRVNGLYYNIADFSVVDYVGGLDDLKQGVLHVIGDAQARLKEDPVRILRAVRFAAKLDFKFDDDLEQGVDKVAPLLLQVSSARMFDEVLKLFMSGHGLATYKVFKKYNLLQYLFAETNKLLDKNNYNQFLEQALFNTDERIQAGKPVTPAFLYAAMLWPVVESHREIFTNADMTPLQGLQTAGIEAITSCADQIMIPKRFRFPMREIWNMQARLEKHNGRQIFKLMAQPRFRAAYDFLLLRAQSNAELEQAAQWWTELIDADADSQRKMIQACTPNRNRRSRHNKNKKKSEPHTNTPPSDKSST